MPQIQCRGVKREEILNISKSLIDELQELLQCSRDNFSLELLNIDFIEDGTVGSGYPIIEVKWFDRGQGTQDKAAKIITNKILNLGYDIVDVYFTSLEKNNYYENGQHF